MLSLFIFDYILSRVHKTNEKMSEKLSDNQNTTGSNNCRYCRENRMHPRLARGESYPCGYKPYRCEVCGYSTTTKGNLTIHLQSDKHANNVRVLQAAGKLPKRITVMPDCHVMTRTVS